MKKSTAETRAAARDYWNSPQAIRLCNYTQRAVEIAAVTAVMLLGSLKL